MTEGSTSPHKDTVTSGTSVSAPERDAPASAPSSAAEAATGPATPFPPASDPRGSAIADGGSVELSPKTASSGVPPQAAESCVPALTVGTTTPESPPHLSLYGQARAIVLGPTFFYPVNLIGGFLLAIAGTMTGTFQPLHWLDSDLDFRIRWVWPWYATGALLMAIGTACQMQRDRAAQKVATEKDRLIDKNHALEMDAIKSVQTLERIEADKATALLEGAKLWAMAIESYEIIAADLLCDIFNLLKLGNDDRVTLYGHFDKGFVCFARYSVCPELRVKGRPLYPLGQGAIGEAWAKGFFTLRDLPDPKTHADDYFKKQAKFGLQREAFSQDGKGPGIRMLARTYASIRIDEEVQGRVTNNLAVLVFESLEPLRPGLSQQGLTKVLNEKGGDLKRFLKVHEPFQPNPDMAEVRGL